MSENVYTGGAVQIDQVDLQAPLSDARGPTCAYYHTAYGRAATAAEENGNEGTAVVYRFLSSLCSFHPAFHSREAPYGPFCSFEDGRRGYVPQDLTDSDIVAVRKIRERITDSTVSARLGDVLWIVAKDYRAAAEAAGAYLESGKALVDGDHWTEASIQFTRAFQLAALHGCDKALWQRVASEVETTILAIPDTDGSFNACQLMNLLLDAGAGNPDAFKGRSRKYAEMAAAEGDHFKARSYWEIEVRWCRVVKDAEGEKAAKLAAAETHVAEAEAHLAKSDPRYFTAGHCLAQGVEALRQAGGDQSRIAELKDRLLGCQQRSMEEMKPMEYKIDIADAVASAREHVDADSFADAVRRFVLGHPLTDPKKVREDVLRLQKECPLASLLATTYVEGDGRVKGHRKNLVGVPPESVEDAIESEMFRNAAQYQWGVRVAAYIEPGRHAIWNKHHPGMQDIACLVNHNPFVPAGHEIIYGRGLLGGFAGDFIMSSLFLVPQIENSVRHVLRNAGHDVINLMADKTQPAKLLGTLLGMDAANDVFGKNLIFELRGLLVEKAGYEFRNRVAHGFVGIGDCHSPAALTVWWVVLRICVIGHLFATARIDSENAVSLPKPEGTA